MRADRPAPTDQTDSLRPSLFSLMDRDDILSISAPTALSPARAFARAWDRMAEPVRREIAALEGLMREIARSAKVLPALRGLAQRERLTPGRSLQTLRRHWYNYQKLGIAGLVDHRRCGGCQLPGCAWSESRLPSLTLSDETLRHWAALDMGNDKQALRESWRAVMRDLMEDKAVPGAGTWRDLWAVLHPWAEVPQVCPWSIHRPPPGWSLSSFRARSAARAVRTARTRL